MEVQMEDRLPSVGVGVEHHAIAALADSRFLRQVAGKRQQLAEQRRILRLIQRRHMVGGDYQQMRRGLGVDVSEGDEPSVALDDGGGDLTRRDLAEDAIAHVIRSEEHTSELQSRQYLVCPLRLEK